ncbi:MAG: DUF349 domain-containing protein [Micrococcales bacterium]|nr:DUF349 domain-containing protein [Micrococcales bacterium]
MSDEANEPVVDDTALTAEPEPAVEPELAVEPEPTVESEPENGPEPMAEPEPMAGPEAPSELGPSVRQQERTAAVAIKESLVAQAERGAITWGRAQGVQEMQRLMGEWKKAGRAAKSDDARLWQQFRAARDLFYGRLDLEQQLRRAAAEEARARKLDLIAQAKQAAESPDVRQAADRMTGLMATWKQAGHAGRGTDEDLWQHFKAVQDDVFARLANERRQGADARAEAARVKRAIIAEVGTLVGAIDIGPARARMRALSDAFHAAGFAGRAVNPDLNALFRQAEDAFYEWANAEPGRRKASGEREQYYVRSRKLQDVGDVRSEIERVEAELAASAPSGKRQRGPGVTLSLGDLSQGNQLRAELMRLRLREAQLRTQVSGIETKLKAATQPETPPESSLGGQNGEDPVEAEGPAQTVGDDVRDADGHDGDHRGEQHGADDPADGMPLGQGAGGVLLGVPTGAPGERADAEREEGRQARAEENTDEQHAPRGVEGGE